MRGYVYVIGLLMALLAVLLLLSFSFQRTLQMETAEQFNRQQLLLARSVVANLETALRSIQDDLLHITHTISLFRVYRDIDFAVLSDMLFKNVGQEKKRVSFLDQNGKIVYTRGNLAVRNDLPMNLDLLAKQKCPSGVQIQQDARRYSLIAPVCRSGGGVSAVIITIDIQDLSQTYLAPIKSGSSGYAWMMDKEGSLLYHPSQPDMVGRNLFRADTSCFTCHTSFDVEKKIIAGTGEPFGRHVAPTGEDKILAFATTRTGDDQWIVAVSAPYSEVTMAIKRSMRLYTWIIILTLIASSAVAATLIITNRKREQAEARERQEKVLEMMHAERLASLDRLTSGITSEIGNPLTSVFSFLQILTDMEENEFKKETLETIFLHMNRIQDILTQLSNFSRIPKLQLKPSKINSIIENTLSLIQYDRRVQDITIMRELSPGIPEITTDGDQLSQVMVNLILNAADAMQNGGTLTIRSRVEGRSVVIDFQDTGVGMTREQMDRITDPFYTTKPQGTGMGLTVSAALLEKLNGRMSVASEPGKGATFSVTLPLAPPKTV